MLQMASDNVYELRFYFFIFLLAVSFDREKHVPIEFLFFEIVLESV